MKRIAIFLIAMLLCNLLAPVSLADGNDVVIEDTTLVSYIGYAESFRVPDGVTAIAPNAFAESYGLAELILSATVTEMDETIFLSLTNLACIRVEEGNPVFYADDGVLFRKDGTLVRYPPKRTGTEYTLPEGVHHIGNEAFRNTALTKINLSYDVIGIGNNAFYAGAIQNINLTNSIQSIGDQAFALCKHLTVLTIPDSVTVLGQGVLRESSVEIATLPQRLKSIPKEFFYRCTSLRHVNMPQQPEAIEAYAFYLCKDLVAFPLPDSVTYLGEAALYYVPLSKQLTISKNLEVIEPNALNVSGVEHVWVDPQNPFFSAEGNAVFNKDKSRLIQYLRNNQTEYTVPYGVKVIGEGAFNTAFLTKITLPNSVEEIGDFAFRMTFPPRPYVVEEKEFQIRLSENLRVIGKGAFYRTALYSIALPDSLESIGENAFEGCTRLTQIVIPDKVHSIGAYAFAETSLNHMELGKGVRTIGPYAFWECPSLKKINIPDTVTRIGEYAFGYYIHSQTQQPYPTTRISCDLGTIAMRYALEHNYPFSSSQGKLGNVQPDLKSEINASDALLILQHSVGLITLDESARLRADTHCDGEITAADALLVLQYSVRLIRKFTLDEKYIETEFAEDGSIYRYIL